MSWINQCKAVFKSKADSLAVMNRRSPHRGINGVIRKLAKESGIPHYILLRWNYEKEMEKRTGKPFAMPICKGCNKNPVLIHNQAVEPTKTGPYTGLCSHCAYTAMRAKKRRKDAVNKRREDERG